ncbi:MAG: sensor domain-containing phosphodiesterase [Oceanospirillaceae bacterium]
MLAADDKLRLKELKKYQLSFDEPEPCFNELSEIACSSLAMPFSGISIVDKDYIWLKAKIGINASSLDRKGAFCSHAISSGQDVYCINDTLEHDFYKSHPIVINFGIRFYASAILRNSSGYPIGTIWVMDTNPRNLSHKDETILLSLSSQVIRMLDYSYSITSTGLPNRRTFIDSLQKIIRAQTVSCFAAVVKKEVTQPQGIVGVFIIDNLDIISSIFAEEGVANALAIMTKRLESSFPKNTILAHIEDNTFAFARVKENDLEAVHYQTINAELSAPITIEGNQINMQTSIGFVSFPDSGNNASSLMFQSMTAARRAKNSSIVKYPEQTNTVSDSFYIKELHRILQAGLTQSELGPYYQPQIDRKATKVSGMEALARWNSASLGSISPKVFIPLAEEAGLISQLDFLILEKVCVDIQSWEKQKLSYVPVSVNFSRESLTSNDTTIRIPKLLAKYAVEHQYIKIEITESTMISDYDPVLSNITRLRELGLQVSIDDFGTGFSNLSLLRLLKFDQLKVDRKFIHNISQDISIAGLFNFIKDVGSLFAVDLVCEGMEKKEDVEYLLSIGCYHHQGWFYSKALCFESICLLSAELEKAKFNHDSPQNHIEMAELFKKYQLN